MRGLLLVKTDKRSKKYIKMLKKECFTGGCPVRGMKSFVFSDILIHSI